MQYTVDASTTSIKIAILLANWDRTCELASRLERDGLHVLAIRNADELVRALQCERVGVAIVDDDLGGPRRGQDILAEVYADDPHPPTILLSAESARLRRRTAKFPVERVMPASTNVEALADIVRTCLPDPRFPRLVIPPIATGLASHVGLEALTGRFLPLLEFVRFPGGSAEQLAEELARDAQLAARAIRLSARSLRRSRRTNSPLVNAIDALGSQRAVTLLLLGSVIESQRRLLSSVPPSLRQWHVMRSLMISSAAGILSDRGSPDCAAIARLLGGMQDIGKLVLAHAFGTSYTNLIRRSSYMPLNGIDADERRELDVSHADVSAAVAQGWNLPSELVSILSQHHDEISVAAPNRQAHSALRIMQAAEAFADFCESRTPQRLQKLNRLLEPFCRASQEEVRPWLEQAINDAAQSAELLDLKLPRGRALSQLLANVKCHAAEVGAVSTAPFVDSYRNNVSVAAQNDVFEGHGRKTVIVIEDDPCIVKTINLFLESTGLDVIWCRTLGEVKAAAPRALAILSDVHLGKESGPEIIKALRQAGVCTPVIMISVDNTRDTVVNCSHAGIKDYLIKPFGKYMLLEKLRACSGFPRSAQNEVVSSTS